MHKPQYNYKTGLYELQEKGITYALPQALITHFKRYYAQYGNTGDWYNVVKNWYNDLPREERNKVKRSGHLPDKQDIFWPD